MNVNVDMDGVLYDFDQALADYICVHSDCTEQLSTPTQWRVWEDWGMSEQEWGSWFRNAVRDKFVFAQGNIYPNGLGGMWMLQQQGHRLRLVTDRLRFPELKHVAVISTVTWLSTRNIPYDAIAFDSRKNIYTADVIIDDKPDLGWVQTEAMNILFDQPWNQDVEETNNIVRAFGWTDVIGVIEELDE